MAPKPVTYSIDDDKDLVDPTLWALMDSTPASITRSRQPLQNNHSNHQTPAPVTNNPPPPPESDKDYGNLPVSPQPELKFVIDGEAVQPEPWTYKPPRKVVRRTYSSEVSETSPLALASVHRSPTAMKRSSPEPYLSPEIGRSGGNSMRSPVSCVQIEENEVMRHCLLRKFPLVSLFKEYQNAAMAILEKTDYTMISGKPFIKKSGWRKISCYFKLSFEIKDKTIQFDKDGAVQRAEFVVRAYMQGGRFSDGWGSCDGREKKFLKPNHDIPSSAETRAKNKACQNLLGIGEYRPGASRSC